MAEDATNDAARRRVSNWLMNINVTEGISHWPESFIGTFDAVFGERHLSLKCFIRSSLVSMFLVILLMLLHCAIYPESLWGQITETSIGTFFVLIAAVLLGMILNVIPDYFSLLETRLILRLISKTNSIKRQIMLLLLDILLTWAILFVYFGLVTLIMLNVHLLSMTGSFSILRELAMIPDTLSLREPIGVFWYTTFFTSIWTWLYFISARFLKMASTLGYRLKSFKSILNINEKPLSAIGFVSCLFVTVLFWIPPLFRHLFNLFY